MPKDSIQKKLSRVRPPRVHITYDVETNGAIEKRELPFVVGVLADLSGNPEKSLPPIKDRKFVEIDRDNVDQVMAKIEPRITMKVDYRLSEEDTKIPVELKFRKMEDFEPAAVAEQVTPIRKLLEIRRDLANLRSNMAGNDKLESLLREVLSNTEAMARLGAEAGVRTPAKHGEQQREEE
jgi:type VI secretion system protein ImpB